MGRVAHIAVLTIASGLAISWVGASQEPAAESGVIRFGSSRPSAESSTPDPVDPATVGPGRRGFDYETFETRLQALWFQRKALLQDGRHDDAARQAQQIRAFCAEEGVRRLGPLAGALVVEADGYRADGQYDAALESLSLADALDPDRPQVHLARTAVLWQSGRRLAAGGELLVALKAALLRSVRDFSLINELALVLVVAVAGCVMVFSLLMLIRYQVPFRHEIEEMVVQFMDERWARIAGWAVLLLPLLLWFAAGWIALYWIVITFRFMQRGERVSAAVLLVATVLSVPAYRMAVAVYGMSADPSVRSTLAASEGEYDPDHILELQELVLSYPEDPVYRFLLAGMYKNGRYFEEAFSEYKAALTLDPALEQGYINVGNIFYTTGQYSEAVVNYRKALEVNPASILAYFNMHLAQSESFRFKDAEASLASARGIDSGRLADMLDRAEEKDQRTTVLDASLEMGSLWRAAIEGRRPQERINVPPGATQSWLLRQLLNPISVAGLVALLCCGVSYVIGRGTAAARRCVRCGRPYCRFCKSDREAHDYCSQCLHLFVLGDGLAAETKTRKLYEVERYERLSRRGRLLTSIVLPGSAQLLNGRALAGTLLLLVWLGAWMAWQPAVLTPFEWLSDLGLRLDLLREGSVPASYAQSPFAVLALLSLPVVWLLGNRGSLRRRRVA